jgi:hypothetical protein
MVVQPRPQATSVAAGQASSRSNPIDRWLFDHYQLGVVARERVKTAVFIKGQLPAEAALRQAAQGLAAEVANGKLRSPRALRWAGWVLIAEGACLAVVVLVIAVFKKEEALAGLPVSLYLFARGGLAVREARRQVQRAQRLDRLGRAGSHDAQT